MERSTDRTGEYHSDIDAFRALAVLAVIVSHYRARYLPHGYLGVDVFFVISGFVVTKSLMGRLDESPSEFLLGFYARRVRRLVPGLALMILLVGLAGIALVPVRNGWLETGMAALFGVSNIYLAQMETDYFSLEPARNFFALTWSLGVEEQFYLLFPALLLWRGRKLAWPLALLGTASLALFGAGEKWFPGLNYYLMPSRFWELACGALAALRGVRPAAGMRRALPAVSWVLIAAIMLQPRTLGGVPRPAIVALSVAAIFASGGSVFPGWLASVGRWSYAMYLWHWPLFFAAGLVVRGRSWWMLPILTAVCIAVSALQYQFLEQPFRRRSWGSNRRTLLSGLAIACTCSAILLGGMRMRERWLEARGISFAGLSRDWAGAGVLKRLSRAGVIDFATFDSPPARGGPTLWILGDSTAERLNPVLRAIAERTGGGVKVMTGRCSPFTGYGIGDAVARQRPCLEYSGRVVSGLPPQLGQGDTVLIAHFDIFRAADLRRGFIGVGGVRVSTDEVLSDFRSRLSSFVLSARERGAAVVFLGPTPVFRRLAAECYAAQFMRRGTSVDCTVNASDQRREHALFSKQLTTVAAATGMTILDPVPALCPDGVCSMYAPNGGNLFSDYYHLSPAGAALLIEPALRAIHEAGNSGKSSR